MGGLNIIIEEGMTYHLRLQPPTYTRVKIEPFERDQETWRGRVKKEQTLDILKKREKDEGGRSR